MIEPVAPQRHGYDFEGRAWPSAVRTLTPTFEWAPFPSDEARAADFQGQLGNATGMRYDLRVFRVERRRPGARVVLEAQGLEAPRYTPPQPLAPDSTYIWSVRARFRLGEAERTTRWSGDWLGGGGAHPANPQRNPRHEELDLCLQTVPEGL